MADSIPSKRAARIPPADKASDPQTVAGEAERTVEAWQKTQPLARIRKAAEQQREVTPPPKPAAAGHGPKPGGKAKSGSPSIPVAPAARPMRTQRRHWLVALSFMIMVVAPAALSAWYLWTRAADQYASFVGFSVRTEEASSAIEILGGITDLSGSSSSDTDILYEFLQGQELVRLVDDRLDLRAIWSRVSPEEDPVFAFQPPGTIEDLVDHWARKVRIYYDSGTGLIDLRVLAYDPVDAQRIAQEVFEQSSAMINALSAVAREDAIGYARDELAQAEERLTGARVALTAFRNRTQIVDPTIDTQGQMGLLNTLQAQLAEALIELDILRETTRESDPRIVQVERRVSVIENRIAQERAVLGTSAAGDSAFADLVGEYERLATDQEFAAQAYTAALAAFDSARNEARRQSRYLAAHVRPTLSEASRYPERVVLLSMITLFAFLMWAVVVLVAYSLRDRR
ncbi:capsule biosynthesis protein [Rhodophyticola porphyridii]|uniref:capsule biosynthesis protein n=1 Tax=Rhodophyticola porphyridii TaxID=1852017 RepID=UPI001F2F4F99|nr:capsule biosynthesis protein [Rhodophyticola porphyridii]